MTLTHMVRHKHAKKVNDPYSQRYNTNGSQKVESAEHLMSNQNPQGSHRKSAVQQGFPDFKKTRYSTKRRTGALNTGKRNGKSIKAHNRQNYNCCSQMLENYFKIMS